MAAQFPESIKSFTQVTDFVDDAEAVNINPLYDEVESVESWLKRTLAIGHNATTLEMTTDLVLTDTDDPIWYLDPTTDAFIVTLPSPSTDNSIKYIRNTNAAVDLSVYSGTDVLEVIDPETTSIFISDAIDWSSVSGGGNAYFDRLTNTATPTHDFGIISQRYTDNDFVNDKAGFEDTQSTPYSFGGSPGSFTLANPGGLATVSSNTLVKSCLSLKQTEVSTNLGVVWSSATAKTKLSAQIILSPNCLSTDSVVLAMRFFDVQSPGGADDYWEFRFSWLGATMPQHPLRAALWYGTGITLGPTDGTQSGISWPINAGFRYDYAVLLTATPQFYVYSYFNAIGSGQLNKALVGHPGNFKEAWIVQPPNGLYHQVHIDDIVIS